MNIYKIWQDEKEDYDSYDSAVVIAETAELAKNIHPHTGENNDTEDDLCVGYWCDTRHVNVQYIGTCGDTSPGVVCASFNAG